MSGSPAGSTSRAGGSTTTRSSSADRPGSAAELSRVAPPLTRRAPRRGRRWVSLVGASAAQVGLSFTEQGVPALVPYLKADLGLTSSGAGVFGVSVNAGRAASGPLAGLVVRRLGVRVTLVASSLTSGVAALAAAAAPFAWLTLALLVVGGVAQSAAIVAGITGVGNWFATSRGIALGTRQAAVSVGGLLAASSVPAAAITWGWRAGLALAGAITIAVGCAGAALYRELAEAPAAARAAGRPVRGGAARTVLADTVIRRTILLAMTLAGSQYVVLAYVQLYFVEELGASLAVAAVMLVAAQAAGVLGRLGWGTLSDLAFAGRRTGLLAGMLGLGAGSAAAMALLPAGPGLAVAVPVVIALGLTTVGSPGMYVALLNDVAPPNLVTATMGTGLTFILGAAVVIPPAFGVLVDATDSYRVAWLALAGMLLLNVPLTRSITRLVAAGGAPGDAS